MAVNPTNIISEFKEADLKVFLETVNMGTFQWSKYFPTEYNQGFTINSIQAKNNASVMGNIVSLGGRTSRLGRESVEKLSVDIPKIDAARELSEVDLIRLEDLRIAASRNPDANILNQIINNIYGDAGFVLRAVYARFEFIAKQLASKGSYTTTKENNSGGVINLTVDYEVPTIKPTKDWSVTGADPVSDIQKAQDEAVANGYSYSKLIADRIVINAILNAETTKVFVSGVANNGGFTVSRKPTLAELNERLLAAQLPIIEMWQSSVSVEGQDGTLTALSGWEYGNAVLIVDETIGSTYYTSKLAQTTAQGTATVNFDGVVSVKVYGEDEPEKLVSKASAFATPVLKNAKRNLIINAIKATSNKQSE